jgi:hypothetical protein
MADPVVLLCGPGGPPHDLFEGVPLAHWSAVSRAYGRGVADAIAAVEQARSQAPTYACTCGTSASCRLHPGNRFESAAS